MPYDFEDFVIDAIKMQNDLSEVLNHRTLTKKALCDIVVPFRNRYKLSDSNALYVARSKGKIDLEKLYKIYKERD